MHVGDSTLSPIHHLVATHDEGRHAFTRDANKTIFRVLVRTWSRDLSHFEVERIPLLVPGGVRLFVVVLIVISREQADVTVSLREGDLVRPVGVVADIGRDSLDCLVHLP